jgi:hypothetical protein
MESIQPVGEVTVATASYEQLEAMRLEASGKADFEKLAEIAQEARKRDGWDDTDPSFSYLAQQCESDIKDVMTYYG